jgi:ElaB/YqjD/DUF883 family membrane-anchored ribosome-binding protein
MAAAAAHLKESWDQGKEAARNARRAARKSWSDLSANVDQYIETRPKTVALEALGVGLLVGFLAGILVSRAACASSTRS